MKFMQTIITIGVLALYLHTQAIAADVNQHTTEAIKHAETAQTHGAAGHVKVLLEHAQESLTHAKAAENELDKAPQKHITESIKHLDEAIAHAKQDHAEVATKHVIEALKHMRESAAE